MIGALLLAGTAIPQGAALGGASPAFSERTLREELRITLEKGTFALAVKDQSLKGAAFGMVHDIILRRCLRPDEQSIDVLDSTRNIRFSFGATSGTPKDTPGRLAGRTLSGRKTGDRWSFTLAGGRKPDAAESNAIKQFTGYNTAVEALAHLYGTAPRKPGDSWSPDLSALKAAVPEVEADLECKLEELTPEQDDTIARVALAGRLSARFGGGNAVRIAINGLIRRSLRDQVDLEIQLNGNFRYAGEFGKGDSRAEISAPLKLVRTVRVVK